MLCLIDADGLTIADIVAQKDSRVATMSETRQHSWQHRKIKLPGTTRHGLVDSSQASYLLWFTALSSTRSMKHPHLSFSLPPVLAFSTKT